MGCASSSPLVESGKNLVETAKDQAGEAVSKGEKTLHDVGEKISTEMDGVKDAMKSALSTAENSLGSVMGKVSNNVNSAKDEAKETVNHMEEDAEEVLNAVSDSTTEAVSEAETVLASEAENAKEMMSSTASEAFEKIDLTKAAAEEKAKDMGRKLEDALHIEDMEQHFDVLGDSVTVEKKVEEIVTNLPTPAMSPVKETQKEQPPPTLWEAAADAIVQQQSINLSEDTTETEIEANKDCSSTDNMIVESNKEEMSDHDEDNKEKICNEFLHNPDINLKEKSY